MIAFEPISQDSALAEGDDVLTVGLDVAFIGLDLDAAELTAALDEATLTAEEFASGPTAWAEVEDPFPTWPTTSHRAE